MLDMQKMHAKVMFASYNFKIFCIVIQFMK